MGLYINPPDMSKELWLHNNGYPIDVPMMPPNLDNVLVCLVDNRAFTAAAVCYNQREFDAFKEPDSRPRKWYWVKKNLLLLVCTEQDLKRYYPDGLDHNYGD